MPFVIFWTWCSHNNDTTTASSTTPGAILHLSSGVWCGAKNLIFSRFHSSLSFPPDITSRLRRKTKMKPVIQFDKQFIIVIFLTLLCTQRIFGYDLSLVTVRDDILRWNTQCYYLVFSSRHRRFFRVTSKRMGKKNIGIEWKKRNMLIAHFICTHCATSFFPCVQWCGNSIFCASPEYSWLAVFLVCISP